MNTSTPLPCAPSDIEISPDEFRQLYLSVLVIQPSPFCNINCDYCYLPSRTSTQRMDFNVLFKVMERVAESGLVGPPFTLLWHAGEPLAVPISWYKKAFGIIRSFPELSKCVEHSFQSNGTLITQEWCEFIKEHKVDIGLSIDGPADLHDSNRKTRSGAGTHAKAIRGAELLKQNGIPFGVVAVISEESLGRADELYTYFRDLGVEGVGFNIEEVEGVNESSSLDDKSEDKVKNFLERIFELNKADGFPLRIREFENALESLTSPDRTLTGDGKYFNLETEAFAMINVDCYGNFSSFSPELLGQVTEKYGSFTYGHVLREGFFGATADARFQQVVADIDAGNKKCAATCPYWNHCGGASPSNKYYENGTFDSAETRHCRSMVQMPLNIVGDYLMGKGRIEPGQVPWANRLVSA